MSTCYEAANVGKKSRTGFILDKKVLFTININDIYTLRVIVYVD